MILVERDFKNKEDKAMHFEADKTLMDAAREIGPLIRKHGQRSVPGFGSLLILLGQKHLIQIQRTKA